MGPRAHSREATLQDAAPSGCGAFLTELDAWGGAWGPRAFPKAGPPALHCCRPATGAQYWRWDPLTLALFWVTLEIPACTPCPHLATVDPWK